MSNKVCRVLGHSSRVRLLSDTNPGVFATLKPPSGDAFSVITKINKAENNIVKRLKFVIYLSFSNLGDTIDFEYPT